MLHKDQHIIAPATFIVIQELQSISELIELALKTKYNFSATLFRKNTLLATVNNIKDRFHQA